MMDSNILGSLGESLAKAGAPILKDVVMGAIGGGNSIQGKIAGAAIDALAEQLGTPTTLSLPKKAEAIIAKVDADPTAAAPVVREVEEQFVRTMDMGTGSLDRYVELLREDSQQQGILQRLWRPLFAIMFTFCYGLVIITICWLIFSNRWGTLTEIDDIAGLLTFMFIAGCAVLGVQVWKRTEEKKSGIA